MSGLWSGSVTKDEGLRSPKAIAFILNKCNRNRNRLKTKNYSILGKSQSVTEFFKRMSFIENRLNVPLMKKLGDKKWIN
jgi:hypothetical protein